MSKDPGPNYDRTAAAADALMALLDEQVADEAMAMTALAMALGRRIGAFASTPGNVAYGIGKVNEVIALEALKAHTAAMASGRKKPR